MLAGSKFPMNCVTIAVQPMHCHGPAIKIHDPILGDFRLRIVTELFFVIPLSVLRVLPGSLQKVSDRPAASLRGAAVDCGLAGVVEESPPVRPRASGGALDRAITPVTLSVDLAALEARNRR